MIKIAYLITAHNNPNHLSELIQSLDSKNVDFYIHIDKKTKFNFKLLNYKNVKIIKSINVFWGEYSQIETSLNLLKNAFNINSYDYYILLSGVDFPVKSNAFIKSFFKKYYGYQFIDLYKMPLYDKSFDRLYYYRFESKTNKYLNYIQQIINKFIIKYKIKRNLPANYIKYNLYAGANWWALDSNCVKYILDFVENNPQYTNFYKNTLCPDEMFFQTIIGNSKFRNKVKNSITYADWSYFPKPNNISINHFKILKKNYLHVPYGNKRKYLLFARKFNDSEESKRIISEIKKKILHK